MNRTKQVLSDCLKKNRLAILTAAVITLLNGAVFLLYDISMEPLIYAELLMVVFLLLILCVDFSIELREAKQREQNGNNILIDGACGIPENTLRDRDYAEMLDTLSGEIGRLKTEYSAKQQADDDYYTAWIHQIKTPIAVMKLQLAEDTAENLALRTELFRIEQYVEMVMDYIRLESDSNDLVIMEYSLDEVIREVLRKYAPQFILKKLKLNYEPTEQTVVTDRKWLSFILDQIISNAAKYTPDGEISVSVRKNTILITDTGIGIAPEDMPRVFEKGYTGANGRVGQESSGLGLFLAKKAAGLLAVRIKCESTVGIGSTFSVELPEKY